VFAQWTPARECTDKNSWTDRVVADFRDMDRLDDGAPRFNAAFNRLVGALKKD
jgi:hypothetical protein